MAITYTDNGGGAPNGSDLEFTYTFPVIQTEDVKVALNGVTQATTKYAVDNVSNPTKITFNNTSVDSSVQNTSGAPKSGVRVRVYRETTVGKANGDEDPKAVFAAGSSIRAIDLNANQEQALFAIHELQTRPIETEDIQNDAITNVKIADDQIDSEHYVAGSIDLEHMSANSVDSDQYVDGSIDHVHLSNDCVDGDNIQDDSINSEHYVDESIDTQHLSNDLITTAKIANSQVTTPKIADANVTTAKIADLNITTAKIADNAITDDKIAGGSLDNRYYTETELDNGQLDNRYFTETELTNGALDGRYFTETEADARYFNISTGDTIKDGDTFPDNDTTIATTAAINDRIIDLVDDVGGFVPVPNETNFPDDNPDINTGGGGGTIVSVKTIGVARTPDSSGVVTIAQGNVSDNQTITITGVPSVLPVGFGFLAETTGADHTYAFHRLVPKATEVTTVAGISSNVTTVATNIADINTVAADLNEATSEIDTVATNITNVNTVGNAIANVNTTAGDIANVNTVAGNIANVNTTAGSISNVNTVAGSIASVNTASSNINSINNFGDQYQVASSAPSNDGGGNSLAAGDLYFDTSSNELRVYNGSTWQGGVTAGTGFAGTGANTFTGDQTIQSNLPTINFTDTSNNPDFAVQNANGYLRIYDTTNSVARFNVAPDGTVTAFGNLDVGAGLDVTGNITVTGNVDGRDIAADGTSLDNIEAGNIGTDVTNGNVKLTPNGTGAVEIKGAGGNDGTLQLNCSVNSHGVKIKAPPHSAAASYTLTLPSNIVNGQFLKTDSSGNLSWASADVVDDTSPQLGGSLDVNDYNISFADSTSPSNNRATFGAGNDFSMYHDGNHTYLVGQTGFTFLYGATGIALHANGSDYALHAASNGSTKLYYDGSEKINTLSTGVNVTGSITCDGFTSDGADVAFNSGTTNMNILFDASQQLLRCDDGVKTTFGFSNDLQIYHSGVNSVIDNNTGGLYIRNNVASDVGGDVFIQAKSGENSAKFTHDGNVELYFDGSKKFETRSDGVGITGNLQFGDGEQIHLGASDDLRLYHDGGNSYIDEVGFGNLFIRSNSTIKIRTNTTENAVVCNNNGSVELYHDNTKKLETTSAGATVTGTLTATSFSGDGSNLTGVSSAEIYGFNTDANGDLIVTTTNGGADNISGSTFDAFEDVVFAATGISFSLDSSGDLIATIS